MSAVFDENLSDDVQDVFVGAWDFSTAFEGPAFGPKSFDVRLPLQKPFRYDPKMGNLILEYRNYSTLPQRFHNDSAVIPGGPLRMIFNDGDPDAVLSAAGSDGADIVEFIWIGEGEGPPSIVSHPKGRVVEEGGDVSLSVIADGAPPLNFRWLHLGVPISGATSPTLVLTNLHEMDSGGYVVLVSNSQGSVASSVAQLEVIPPFISRTTVPNGYSDREGNGALASLSNPIRVQELYGASEFPPSAIFIRELRLRPDSQLSAFALTQALSRVRVRLSTLPGPVQHLSSVFAENVGPDEKVVYDGQWIVESGFLGAAGGAKEFDIVMKLQEVFRYDPARGNLIVDFQNFGSLPLRFHHDAHSNPLSSSAGRRAVSMAFSDGNPNSATASIVTDAASILEIGYSVASGTQPLILVQPKPIVLQEGEAGSFSVEVIGSSPITYQWFRNSIAFGDNTNSSLKIITSRLVDSGEYFVVVSNAFGSTISSPATLSIIPGDAKTLVVPQSVLQQEATGASAAFSGPARLQELYHSSLFPPQPIVIHEIRFRPDVTYAVGSFAGTLTNIQFSLSTSPRSAGNLSKRYEDNVGADVQEVFSGSWSFETDFSGPVGGPKVFDIRLPLHTPFHYNPRLGNLLLEFRNYSSLPVRFHTDAASGGGVGVGMVFSDGQPNAVLASVANFAADALEIVYSVETDVPPTFTKQPIDSVVVEGQDLTLSAETLGGAPLSHVWFFNGIAVPGATNSSIVFKGVNLSHDGVYFLLASNRVGLATSSPVTLRVLKAPSSLMVVPGFAEHIEGDGASAVVSLPMRQQELYSSSLFPAGPKLITQLRYRVDSGLGGLSAFGVMISNIQVKCSTTLQVPGQLSLLFADNVGSDETVVFKGNWYVSSQASGKAGEARTFDIILPLMTPFLFDPAKGNLLVETINSNRASRLYVFDGAVSGNGLQRIFIEDPESPFAVGGDSSAAILQIGYEAADVPPEIVQEPSDQEVVVGASATFKVKVAGALPLSFRWWRNGSVMESIVGSELHIPFSSLSDSGVYFVEIKNAFGIRKSREFTLQVKPGPAAVSIASSSAFSSGQAILDILLAANGGENALSFSLAFDPTLFAFREFLIDPELNSASVNLNTSQIALGRVGVAIAMPPSSRFAAGLASIGKMFFRVAPVTADRIASVEFSDQPVMREVVDSFAQPLESAFRPGQIAIIFPGFEADVAPRPEGDRRLTLGDWVQVGRFVAGLDDPSSPEEFQRVDCAPAETAGDGRLTVKDWVQSGRYAANLDALAVAGGPFSNIVSAPLLGPPSIQDVATTEIVLGELVGEPGQTVSLPVTLTATGGEAAIGFSIRFDPSTLIFSGVEPDTQSGGALFNVNSRQSSNGRIGVALALPGGTQFSAGAKRLAKVNFTVRSVKAGSSPVTFDDVPIVREVVNGGAKEMSASFGPGSVVIGVGAPEVQIAVEGATLLVSWAASASGFVLEASPALLSPVWSVVDSQPVLQGQVYQVRLPSLSGVQTYFRLRQ